MSEKARVFVYGTLKRGGALHFHLRGAGFLGEATLFGYRLYRDPRQWYPMILKSPDDSPSPQRVLGEVFEVSRAQLAVLDRVEDEGRRYTRIATEVQVGSRTESCFVYVWKGGAAGLVPIETGRWEVRSNGGTQYSFPGRRRSR